MCIKTFLSLFKKTRIEYENRNSQWNSGHISVYVRGKLMEHIFVDEYLENNKHEDVAGVDDIIDLMKAKYGIRKVVEDAYNWR